MLDVILKRFDVPDELYVSLHVLGAGQYAR
jgi:hypothetical protein